MNQSIEQVADDLAHRIGQLPDQSRNGHDLVVLGEPRVLEQIDHLDLVAPGEVLLAYLLQVPDGGE